MNRPATLNHAKSGPMNLLASPVFICLILFIAAAVLYGWWPTLGLSAWPSPMVLMRMVGLLIGLLVYGVLVEFLLKKPWWLMFYVLLVWPFSLYIHDLLADLGIHLPVRIMTFAVVAVPTVMLGIKHFGQLWRNMIFFRFVLVFLGICGLYYQFNNVHFVDPNMANIDYIDQSKTFLLSLFYCAVSIAVCYIGIWENTNHKKLFDQINMAIIIYTILQALCVLVGYPFHLFGQVVEGFFRSQGWGSHPNNLAHNSALFIFYFIGLIGYYNTQPDKAQRVKPSLLYTGLIALFLMFILAISKNAIMLVMGLLVLYAVISFIVMGNKKPLFYFVGLFSFAAIVFPILYTLLTGESFIELLEARFSNVSSRDWRFYFWTALLNNIEPSHYLLGNGLSSAAEFMGILSKNVDLAENAVVYVHNATVQLLYEMGLVGLFYYLSFLSFNVQSISLFRQLSKVSAKSLQHLAIAAVLICIYFFLCAQADEVMFSAISFIFWGLVTMIFAYISKELAAAKKSETVPEN